MVNSSFQTENCWMYFGRQPMSHEPYLCRSSALDWYLSAGLTRGALRVPIWSRGAARGFWPSLGTATLLRAVVAKHRTTASLRATSDGFAGRRAEARALFLQSLLAMVEIEGAMSQLIENQPVASIETALGDSVSGLTSSLELGPTANARETTRDFHSLSISVAEEDLKTKKDHAKLTPLF